MIGAEGPLFGATSMNIVIEYDSTVANAPAGYKTAVQAAVDFIDHLIANPISVPIVFSYGTIQGQALDKNALGESETNGNVESYGSLVSLLTAAAASTADREALAALPATDPTNGGGFWVSDTLANVFGLGSEPGFTDPEDGFVGLSSQFSFTYDPNNRAVAGEFDAIGVLEHEITEVLGRIDYQGQGSFNGQKLYAPLDLLHYSGPGVHTVAATGGYFSVDGQTMLLPFNDPNNGGDGGDWASSIVGDSFGDGYSGNPGNISPTDVLVMDLLGFTVSYPHATDFHNDGLSDVLMQSTQATGGLVAIGEARGGQIAYTGLGGLGSAWSFEANGDFLGDGRAGYLLKSSDGLVTEAELGPDVRPVYTNVASLGSIWDIIGAGNLLGDGKADFLMQSTQGTGGYLAVGEVQVSTGHASFTNLGSLGSAWAIEEFGDFLGKGHDQFLMESSPATGSILAVGDVENGQVRYTTIGAGLGANWTFVGAGDFLGDGHTQFLIENTGGLVAVGEVGAGQAITYTTISSLGSMWKFIGSGDYLSLGHDQFLIQSSGGLLTVGEVVNGQTHYVNVGGLGPEWAFHN